MPPLITYTTADLKALTDRISGYTKVAQRGDGAFSSLGNPAWYTWYDDENATGDLGDLILKPDDNTGFWVVAGDRTYYAASDPPALPLTTGTMQALGYFEWINTTTGAVWRYLGGSAFVLSSTVGAIATSGRVAEYRFDEMSGTTVTNYGTGGPNGSIVGTAGTNYQWIDWAPRGLQFNGGGSGGYVDISQSGFNWFGADGITVEVVYAGISNQSFCRWFECGSTAGATTNTFAFCQSSDTTGLPIVAPGFSLSPSTGFDGNVTASLAVTNWRWQYWACTFGGGNIRIFNNLNQARATATYSGSIVDTTRAVAYIGRSFGEGFGDGRLNGVMALLRVYNRVLSNTERRLNYLATRELMARDGIYIV